MLSPLEEREADDPPAQAPVAEPAGLLSGAISRILTTTFVVILSAAIARVFEFLDVRTAYLVFLPVITGACAIGGLGLGLWAAGLSALALWCLFLSPDGLMPPGRADLAHLCVFVIVACFGCWVIDGLRRTREELSRDNAFLGRKIALLLRRKKAP
jgi:K+-sensing histidine kinase KdpD